jgi:putative hydrolase of the HAD superfamily
MKYRHLFFDLDHTLWDFETNALHALKDVYQQLCLAEKGITPFEDFYSRYLHHNEILWGRYHKGFITADELKWKRMWRTLLDFKLANEAFARELSAAFLDILPEKKGVFPYTFEILTYLKNKGYILHLITNGFEKTQWRKLNSSGLNLFFDEVITSEGSNSVKPQKEIFDFALMKTGALPEQSIMLGDNPEADIAGAVNAGWDSVFVNHNQLPVTFSCTYSIQHLKELEGIL